MRARYLTYLSGPLLGLLLTLAGTAQAAPAIQHWQTANGVRAYFIPTSELPMVDIRIVFDAGSARDAGQAGLASLTNRLLADGAGNLNADQIADIFASRGALLGYGSARDMAWVSLRSLSDEDLLAPAVNTVALMLKAPTFGETGFNRERDRMVTDVRQQDQEPDDIAEKKFYAAVYGKHPYASPPDGTEQSLHALTRQQVVDLHKRYYVARNAVLAIVGALTREQAQALAETLVSGLPAGEPAPPLPQVADMTAEDDVTVNFPSTQTHLRLGQPGQSRHDPDYFPLYVGNHVLGGSGLVSRLSKSIREKRGLSYSVFSYFVPMRRLGPFVLGLQTKNAQADEAMKLLRENLARFVSEGPTDEELTASKKNIVGGFPLRIDSNSELVEYLAMIGFYGLALDYLDTFTTHVEQVTREQIRDAFERRIHPDKLAVIRVGEIKKD